MMDDIDRIMAVMEAAFDPAFGEAWNRRQVSDSLAMPHTYYILLDEDGKTPAEQIPAAGFVLIKSAPGEEELLLVGVTPNARRKGIGKRLIELFASKAKMHGAERIFLEMRSNNPAESLYLSLGFEPIGRRKDYYRMPGGGTIDAVTFARKI